MTGVNKNRSQQCSSINMVSTKINYGRERDKEINIYVLFGKVV